MRGWKTLEMEAMASETLTPKIKRRSGVLSLPADMSIITARMNDAMNDTDPVIVTVVAKLSFCP